ncbi:MAG: hypothetical protein RIG63_27055 [Coleofasciculus chthonoplastes F3-SA18-01]|uniref:hypothetical protein n=1 Tax=Coleofasciculus chthonoplastes TaxID=64178 RepID=UPI0032FBAF9C
MTLTAMLVGNAHPTVYLETLDDFLSVSRFYEEFARVNTDEPLVYLQDCNHLPHQQ